MGTEEDAYTMRLLAPGGGAITVEFSQDDVEDGVVNARVINAPPRFSYLVGGDCKIVNDVGVVGEYGHVNVERARGFPGVIDSIERYDGKLAVSVVFDRQLRLGKGKVEQTDYALPNFKPQGHGDSNTPVTVLSYEGRSGTYMGTNLKTNGGRRILSTAGYFVVASVMKGNDTIYTTRLDGGVYEKHLHFP